MLFTFGSLAGHEYSAATASRSILPSSGAPDDAADDVATHAVILVDGGHRLALLVLKNSSQMADTSATLYNVRILSVSAHEFHMRTWLEENEIYFRTLASALLAVMALVVSVASVYVASQQVDLSRASYQPHIRAIPYELRPSDSDELERGIELQNTAAPIDVVKVFASSFVKIRLSDRADESLVPILGFLVPEIENGNTTGAVARVKSGKASASQYEIAAENLGRISDSAHIEIISYVLVFSQDRFGDYHGDFFKHYWPDNRVVRVGSEESWECGDKWIATGDDQLNWVLSSRGTSSDELLNLAFTDFGVPQMCG